MNLPIIRKGEPTLKQIKALQNINKGMSQRRAMIEAGYSLKTASHARSLFKNVKVQRYLSSLKSAIENKGIDNDKLATKFAEWIDAEKPFSSHTEPDQQVPDYETQIKAYDRIKDIFGEEQPGRVKRKLTITEFINEDPEKPIENA